MFGRSLEETMAVETRLGGSYVPIFLHRCVTFLREHGGGLHQTSYSLSTYLHNIVQPCMRLAYFVFPARQAEFKI
jgi:hypothetical protein